jgi:hypothetical protein
MIGCSRLMLLPRRSSVGTPCSIIMGSTLGDENTYGVVSGRTPVGPFSYAQNLSSSRYQSETNSLYGVVNLAFALVNLLGDYLFTTGMTISSQPYTCFQGIIPYQSQGLNGFDVRVLKNNLICENQRNTQMKGCLMKRPRRINRDFTPYNGFFNTLVTVPN